MNPVEKILDKLIEQAKQGSCKTCRWCSPLPPNFELAPGEYVTHICEMQPMNGIYFTPGDLDSQAYPWRCDVGTWYTDDSKPIYGCLAYQSSSGVAVAGDDAFVGRSQQHYAFMRQLARAINLHHDIQNNILAKLTAALNEAEESIPEPSWKEKHNVIAVGQPASPGLDAFMDKILSSPDGTLINPKDFIDK